MKILFIGDVIGRPGRTFLAQVLDNLKDEYRVDLTIVNGENVAGGVGITKKTMAKLFNYGADVITLGNHTFKYREMEQVIEGEDRVLRPINYPPGVPGTGLASFFLKKKGPVAIISVMGRIFMNPIDCPFRAIDRVLDELESNVKVIVVDFHAEATSEKNAFALYVDGRVSAVIGTHTHIPTADERILPKGTAYITDVGMVGGLNSVIGSEPENVTYRFLTQLPRKFEPAQTEIVLNGVLIDVDETIGKARTIERIRKFSNEIYDNREDNSQY